MSNINHNAKMDKVHSGERAIRWKECSDIGMDDVEGKDVVFDDGS